KIKDFTEQATQLKSLEDLMEDFANYDKEQSNLVCQEIEYVKNKIENAFDDSIDALIIELSLLSDPLFSILNNLRGNRSISLN
ncbi:10965_t:CDS:2, partial [Gigaspora rosea]